MNKELVEMARESGGIDLTNTRANVTIWLGTGTSDFLDAFAKLIAEKAIKEALKEHAMCEVQRLGQEIEQPKVRTGDCLLVGVCASEGHKIAPQRTWVGLTEEEMMDAIYAPVTPMERGRRVEAKLRSKNTRGQA